MRFDRFARSSQHLVEALHAFRHLDIQFVSYNENIDTGSPLGEAMFTITSAMAQLERDIIMERVKAGLKNSSKKGKTLGRPKVKVNVTKTREMKDRGYSLRQIANEMNVPCSTLCRSLN